MCSNTSSRSTTRGGRAGRWIFAKRLAGLTRRVVLSGAEASAQRLSPLLKSRAQRGHKLGTDPLARLEGFEPPTNGFGSHYSIRLSYRRVRWAAYSATEAAWRRCPEAQAPPLAG